MALPEPEDLTSARRAANQAIAQHGLFIEHLLATLQQQDRKAAGTDDEQRCSERFGRIESMTNALEAFAMPMMAKTFGPPERNALTTGAATLRELEQDVTGLVTKQWPAEAIYTQLNSLIPLVETVNAYVGSHMSTKPIALIAEDELLVANLMERLLRNTYEVRMHTTGEAALQDAQQLQAQGVAPSILITDQGLDGKMKGLELISQVRAISPDVPVLMVSGGDASIASAVTAQRGVFLPKPMQIQVFRAAVSQAYQAVGAQEPGAPGAGGWQGRGTGPSGGSGGPAGGTGPIP